MHGMTDSMAQGFFVVDVLSIGVPFGLADGMDQAEALEWLGLLKMLRLVRLNSLITRLWSPSPQGKKYFIQSY